jgi:hypothetical protein
MLAHFIKCHTKPSLYIAKAAPIKKNVFVSLTTTPTRIKSIWPTLNSLLLQTVLPEHIILWIPKTHKRFKKSITQLPPFLKHPHIQVRFIDEDYGPATKLLPAIKVFLKMLVFLSLMMTGFMANDL